jgi:OmpA-OmpF porin, OOP family
MARFGRLHLAGALVPMALVLLPACSEDGDAAACDAEDVPVVDPDTIVIEGDAWSGYAPFRTPEDLFAGTGIDAIYVDQPCQAARAEHLTEGVADIALTTLDQYIRHAPAGRVVGVIDQSLGADALVAGNQHVGVDSVEDLPLLVDGLAEDEGRKPVIAYTGSSPSEMLLNELSNSFEELRLDDYELVSVDQSATAYQMLQDGDADLAVVWEPDVSAAAEADYPVVLSSADVPDSIVDVIVASEELVLNDQDALREIVDAYYSAMDEYLQQPGLTDLTDLYADDTGIEDSAEASQVARQVIEGITLYGSAEASAFLNQDEFPLDRPQVQQSIESIGSLLALLDSGIDPDRARVDGSYVQEVAGP